MLFIFLNFYWTKINVLDIIEVRKKLSTRIKINKYMFLFKKNKVTLN
jgi:hypothetical protein